MVDPTKVFASSAERNETNRRIWLLCPRLLVLILLVIHKLYAPHRVRCCRKHLLSSSRLLPEEFVNMINRQPLKAALSTETLVDLVNDLLMLRQEATRSPRLDFSDPSLSDEDYEAWTGWKQDQFKSMLEEVTAFLRSSANRQPIDAFAIFWIKVKNELIVSTNRITLQFPRSYSQVSF